MGEASHFLPEFSADPFSAPYSLIIARPSNESLTNLAFWRSQGQNVHNLNRPHTAAPAPPPRVHLTASLVPPVTAVVLSPQPRRLAGDGTPQPRAASWSRREPVARRGRDRHRAAAPRVSIRLFPWQHVSPLWCPCWPLLADSASLISSLQLWLLAQAMERVLAALRNPL